MSFNLVGLAPRITSPHAALALNQAKRIDPWMVLAEEKPALANAIASALVWSEGTVSAELMSGWLKSSNALHRLIALTRPT